MKNPKYRAACTLLVFAACSLPAFATVKIKSLSPSVAAPQKIGAKIIWTVKATDSNSGPLVFQFNIAPPNGAMALVKDFNVGTLNSGVYTSQPFSWVPTGIEGTYQVQVVVKDFGSGESMSTTVSYAINPLVTGATPVAITTSNPLVAVFSAPSCAAGSSMRVSFQDKSGTKPAAYTNYLSCRPPNSMTFEIAGMYPKSTYKMFAQVNTGGTLTNGPAINFTTGSLPTNVPFSSLTVNVPPGVHTDTKDPLILLNPVQFGSGPLYADVAVDLSGKILWYYYGLPPQSTIITRPLPGGSMLTFQRGTSWDPTATNLQLLRQIDLAGNIIKETNTGILAEQLLALGDSNAGPCFAVPRPAPVGAGCLDSFSHDAIMTLPNGDLAVELNLEKIFPPGTQGDTSGLPVDIVGDIILVLDTNWQVKWYFDTFQHAGGAPQLDINRAAVLGETCTLTQQGCGQIFLLGNGIAPYAKDWTHGNSIYYWPQDGDLIWSSRHQDWIVKIDYQNGTGTGNILWRMGPCGDFKFNNIYGDPWPWNSHQHDVGIENGGAGPMTLFDNGNTRVSPPTGPGSSTGCMAGAGTGNSRGMAVNINESSLQVTPVLSADLGVYSTADGSAQLLSDGNYFFVPAVVLINLTTEDSFSIEIYPTPGTDTGTQVLNISATDVYRAWQLPDLYTPPTT